MLNFKCKTHDLVEATGIHLMRNARNCSTLEGDLCPVVDVLRLKSSQPAKSHCMVVVWIKTVKIKSVQYGENIKLQ